MFSDIGAVDRKFRVKVVTGVALRLRDKDDDDADCLEEIKVDDSRQVDGERKERCMIDKTCNVSPFICVSNG